MKRIAQSIAGEADEEGLPEGRKHREQKTAGKPAGIRADEGGGAAEKQGHENRSVRKISIRNANTGIQAESTVAGNEDPGRKALTGRFPKASELKTLRSTEVETFRSGQEFYTPPLYSIRPKAYLCGEKPGAPMRPLTSPKVKIMCCKEAVERAYQKLSTEEQPRDWALEAALTIFRYHHPEVPLSAARAQVEAWAGGTIH